MNVRHSCHRLARPSVFFALVFGFVLVFQGPVRRRFAGAGDDGFVEPEHIEVMDDRFEHAVGSVGIDEAHRRGLPHQGANVLLFRPPARPGGPLEMMVLMRSSKMLICPDTELPGMGEHAHPGETMSAAASRGLREELGLHRPAADLISFCTCIYSTSYMTSRGHRIDNMRIEWFYWVLPPGTVPELDSETTAVGWREPQALLDIAEHGHGLQMCNADVRGLVAAAMVSACAELERMPGPRHHGCQLRQPARVPIGCRER